MNTRAILLATLLLTASFAFLAIAPTAQAVGTPAQVDDIYRQLLGTSAGQAGQSCSTHRTTTSGNPVALQGGVNYIYAEGMAVGGLTPVSVTMHVAGNGTTLISAGPSFALVTGGGMNPASVIQWFSGGTTGQSGFYNVTQFTMPYTASVYFDYAYSGSGSCFTQDGFSVPPIPSGLTAGNQLLGWVADLQSTCSGCTPATATVGYMLSADVTPIGESGILTTETTKTPTTTQFTWTQIGSSQAVSYSATTGTTNPSVAQSLTIPATAGKYASTLAVRVKSSCAPCSGTWSFAILNSTLPAPYDNTQELTNATFTYSWSGNGNALLTIDFVAGLVSSDNAALTLGSPTFKAFGAAATSATRIAQITPGGTNYIRFYDSVQGSSADVDINTGNPYSGGTVWTYSHATNTWTQVTANDFTQVVLTSYGGNTAIYSFSETDKHAGGASYTYFCEGQIDSNPQRYTLSSSFGGGARLGSFQSAGNNLCTNTGFNGQSVIQEWRLGFETIPVNASTTRTITLDTSGSGRNLLYVGTFAGTQPTSKLHLHGPYDYAPTAGNNIRTYRIFSTDDYFSQIFFTVRECVTQNADGTCSDVNSQGANTANGAIIPNGSYSGTVSVLRAIAGTWDANGQFNLTGQDIPSGQIALTIQASGYTTDNQVRITVPSGGAYFVNLTMTKAGATGISVSQGGVTCSFDTNAPSYTTGQLMSINVSRTKTVELWFSLFRISNGGTQQITSMFDWTTSLNNTVLFAYPNGQTLQQTDSGQYILAVFTPTTSTTRGNTICYDTIGVNQAGNFPVSSNLVQDLNTVAQTAITAQSTINGQGGTAQLQKTTYDDYLILLDWGFGSIFFGIPNMVVILFVFLGGALLLRFGRGSGGGNQ